MLNLDEWQDWEAAVRRSYTFSIGEGEEELVGKMTDDAVTKIAYYLRVMYGGDQEGLDMLDDTASEYPNDLVQTLFDFLANIDGLTVEQMRQFYTDEAVAAAKEREARD